MYIVAIGEVGAVVPAAALFAPQRRRAIRRPTVRMLAVRQSSASRARPSLSRASSSCQAGSRTASARVRPARSRNSPTSCHISRDRSQRPSCTRASAGPVAPVAPSATRGTRWRRCARSRSVVAHRQPGARAEHEPFEQRVAGEPVRAVDARACDLARREQARASSSGRRDRSPRRPSRSARPARPACGRARDRAGAPARVRDQRKPRVHEVRVQLLERQVDRAARSAPTSRTIARATRSRGARSPAGS